MPLIRRKDSAYESGNEEEIVKCLSEEYIQAWTIERRDRNMIEIFVMLGRKRKNTPNRVSSEEFLVRVKGNKILELNSEEKEELHGTRYDCS